jgi:hypothetical protein
VDNSAYLTNLGVRIQELGALLRGDHFWYLGEPFANRWAPALAAALVIGAALACLGNKRKADWGLLLPVAFLALIVAQSAFTVSDLFITHFVLLLPLLPLAGGLAFAALWRIGAPEGVWRARSPRLALAALGGALVLWWGGADLWTTVRYHQVLSIAGGYGAHSDAIYGLTDYLEDRAYWEPLALDWGIDAPVRFLSAGRVNPTEVFGYSGLGAPDAGFAERVGPMLGNPNIAYLAHSPRATVFNGRLPALQALAAVRGLTLPEECSFAERNGEPLLVIYRAVE